MAGRKRLQRPNDRGPYVERRVIGEAYWRGAVGPMTRVELACTGTDIGAGTKEGYICGQAVAAAMLVLLARKENGVNKRLADVDDENENRRRRLPIEEPRRRPARQRRDGDEKGHGRGDDDPREELAPVALLHKAHCGTGFLTCVLLRP